MDNELSQFARVFQDEDALRKSIASLFRHRRDVEGVEITHGPLERGKDVVFYVSDPIGERKLFACVVKHGKISGSADSNNGAMNVLTQVRQALENPYLNPSGQEDHVAHVYVMSPHEVSQNAMFSIQGELKVRSGQVTFCCGGKLLNLFRKHWPDFLLESGDLGVYLSQLQNQIDKDDPVSILLSEHSVFGASAQYKRTYVRPKFTSELVEYECKEFLPSSREVTGLVRITDISDLRTRIRHASQMLALPHFWYDGPLQESAALEAAKFFQELAEELLSLWEKGYDNYVNERTGVVREPKEEVEIRLAFPKQQAEKLETSLHDAEKCIKRLGARVLEANRFVRDVANQESLSLRHKGYLNFCAVREIASRLPVLVVQATRERSFTFGQDLFIQARGSIFITGSAGHGKTSFCQQNALADAKDLTSERSEVLPIYIKLHHLAARQLGSYEEEFFSTSELRSLTSKASEVVPGIKKIRLYLDGLDEVPRIDRQRELMELAKQAVVSDPRIDVITTGRNYINGPWLNWMPRVSISQFDDAQISELVKGLLGQSEEEVQKFFVELNRVPSLVPLMRIPLLGTLIVSVYRKRTTLPENRVRLYETFLNLMCGGWDLAKNVRRRTNFGSVGKLSVLTRLAGHMQINRATECNDRSLKVAVESSNPAYSKQTAELTQELLEDGVLTRSGAGYAFCHQSFQEYLAAKDFNDPSGRRQENVLRWYFRGDDWWYQMLSFYIGSLGKPEDTEHWLHTTVREAAGGGSVANDARIRYRRLLECILECAPGYTPRSTNPFADLDAEDAQDSLQQGKKATRGK